MSFASMTRLRPCQSPERGGGCQPVDGMGDRIGEPSAEPPLERIGRPRHHQRRIAGRHGEDAGGEPRQGQRNRLGAGPDEAVEDPDTDPGGVAEQRPEPRPAVLRLFGSPAPFAFRRGPPGSGRLHRCYVPMRD